MNRILYKLEKYWDVEHIPKHDLSKEHDDYFIDIKVANLFYIVIVITLFTITALFIGGGMLS